jgi:uncharacterized protein
MKRRILIVTSCITFITFAQANCSMKGGRSLDYKQHLEAELMNAVKSGNVDDTRKALHQGIDVNARDKHDRTALMHAAEHGHTQVVRELLRNGADPRLKDKYFGRTALMRAMRSGNIEMVKELLDSEAEINSQDNGFETALMIAVYYNREDLVQLLLTRGRTRR